MTLVIFRLKDIWGGREEKGMGDHSLVDFAKPKVKVQGWGSTVGLRPQDIGLRSPSLESSKKKRKSGKKGLKRQKKKVKNQKRSDLNGNLKN